MKTKVRLYGIVVALLLCVLFLAGVTYTWMAANRGSDGDGMQIQMDGKSMSVTGYRVLRFDPETNAVVEITDPGVDRYDLIPYDSIFTERNKNTPLLLRAELDGIPTGSTSLSFTVSCDASHDEPQKEISGNIRWTSDILYVNYITESELNDLLGTSINANTAIQTMFDTVTGYLISDAASAGRVQFAEAVRNGNTWNYAPEKTVDLPCQVDLTAADTAAQSSVVYIIFDYNPDLIAAQHITHFSDIQIQLGEAIQFDNDIRRITFTGISDPDD